MRRRLPIMSIATLAMMAIWGAIDSMHAQSGQPQPQASANGLRSHTIHMGELQRAPDPDAFRRPRTDNPFKGGNLVRGASTVAAAWFSGPSNRYRHYPFGTEQHPTVLTVSLKDRRVMRLVLPKDSVFEDRTPRIVDLDGDGREEILVVRSYERKGSALAVVAVRGNELEIIAETPPLGTPFQWLNPIGVGDFNGDGRLDVALVTKPHREGELQIWTFRDGGLVLLADTDDVSNHVFGSRHLRLSAIADFNGDGIADIAVPSSDRRRVRFLSFANGRFAELGEAGLQAPASEDFELATVDGKPAVRIGLASGRGLTIAPCRDIQGFEMAGEDC
jgi:hypothetical protein